MKNMIKVMIKVLPNKNYIKNSNEKYSKIIIKAMIEMIIKRVHLIGVLYGIARGDVFADTAPTFFLRRGSRFSMA